jgi:addiction module RelB/DinJ family antitoxin
MTTKLVNFRADEKLKSDFEALADNLGLSATSMYTAFMKRAVAEQAMPFVLSLQRPAAALSFEIIKEQLNSIFKEYPNILSAHLFGSYARGDADAQSDIDLSIEMDDKQPFTLIGLEKLRLRIKNALGKNCDILTQNQMESLSKRGSTIPENYQRDRVKLYEKP